MKVLDYNGLKTFATKIKSLLAGKQDKLTAGTNVTIEGTTISAKDTTYDLSPYAKTSDVDNKLAVFESKLGNKVNKVPGKVLSDNNYTNADKAKVGAIPTNPKYTDTVYKHPSSHPASMITETADRKFISNEDKEKLDSIENNAVSVRIVSSLDDTTSDGIWVVKRR